MRLSQFTDIGLKSIMYLKQASQLVTIDEIANQFKIPRNHLVKVLNFMMHKEWISSTRGRNGGMLYNIKSDNLKLGDVIAVLENKDELLDCDNCVLGFDCHLRGILKKAINVFYDSLNQYTLKELNNDRTKEFIIKMINIKN